MLPILVGVTGLQVAKIEMPRTEELSKLLERARRDAKIADYVIVDAETARMKTYGTMKPEALALAPQIIAQAIAFLASDSDEAKIVVATDRRRSLTIIVGETGIIISWYDSRQERIVTALIVKTT